MYLSSRFQGDYITMILIHGHQGHENWMTAEDMARQEYCRPPGAYSTPPRFTQAQYACF